MEGECFEYKYIWRDRNTSFSKMRGRYDRACCSDNFNRKKVIIQYLLSAIVACDYKLDRIQSNFVKTKQEPRGHNITSDKLEFVPKYPENNVTNLQENFDNFCRKILTIFL